jgi:peptide/nickel transport system ATP-binding protein
MENKLLEINNLEIKFHTDDGIVHAVNGLDLSLSAGETLRACGRDWRRQDHDSAGGHGT